MYQKLAFCTINNTRNRRKDTQLFIQKQSYLLEYSIYFISHVQQQFVTVYLDQGFSSKPQKITKNVHNFAITSLSRTPTPLPAYYHVTLSNDLSFTHVTEILTKLWPKMCYSAVSSCFYFQNTRIKRTFVDRPTSFSIISMISQWIWMIL